MVAWSARGMTVPLWVRAGAAGRRQRLGRGPVVFGTRKSCSVGGDRVGRGGWRFGSVPAAVVEGAGLDGQGGEGVELCRVELDVGGGGVGPQLVDGFGADDDRRD